MEKPTEKQIKQLTIRLNDVPRSYFGFICGVRTYVRKKQSRFDAVSKYMDEHPSASSSDILGFITNQDDFFEDAVYDKPEVC